MQEYHSTLHSPSVWEREENMIRMQIHSNVRTRAILRLQRMMALQVTKQQLASLAKTQFYTHTQNEIDGAKARCRNCCSTTRRQRQPDEISIRKHMHTYVRVWLCMCSYVHKPCMCDVCLFGCLLVCVQVVSLRLFYFLRFFSVRFSSSYVYFCVYMNFWCVTWQKM